MQNSQVTREQPVMLRLLGPVEVFDQGRVLEVGPPQRQAVLSALAVDADAPVPVELLVHRVWGWSPPDGARAALHAHLTRLRRVLAQTRNVSVRLNRRNVGYVLEIDRDQVDLHRVQTLLGRAREPGCEDDRRAGLLREALDMWRGPPLVSVAGDWAARVRSGLEPQLISAAVEWAWAELRLGNSERAADRLGHLLTLHPLSEPLVAALMRALCATGRRSEALQRYVAVRAQLREELGTEPGPQLRGLHTAILRGELDATGPGTPAGGALGPAGRFPVGRTPRQLPTPAGLAGRQRELATVRSAFAARAGSVTVVVSGPAGVGTSSLAIHAAHRLAGSFPDGQLYMDLRGATTGATPREPAELLDRLLRALGSGPGERPGDLDESAALYRSITADLRLLVVLDNAGSAAAVRPLAPAGPGCGLLVASRRALVGLDGARQVDVDVLTAATSVELLGRLVGTRRVAAEPDAAAQVAYWCGYLPLALRAAGARLARRPAWPVAELARRLADERHRLDELEYAELSTRRSLTAGYRELADSADPVDRQAAAVFAWLGRSGCSELAGGEAAALLGRSAADADRLLERLVDARLLDSEAPGRFRMPDLLRLVAAEQHAGPPTGPAARTSGSPAATLAAASHRPAAPSSSLRGLVRPHPGRGPL